MQHRYTGGRRELHRAIQCGRRPNTLWYKRHPLPNPLHPRPHRPELQAAYQVLGLPIVSRQIGPPGNSGAMPFLN